MNDSNKKQLNNDISVGSNNDNIVLKLDLGESNNNLIQSDDVSMNQKILNGKVINELNKEMQSDK